MSKIFSNRPLAAAAAVALTALTLAACGTDQPVAKERRVVSARTAVLQPSSLLATRTVAGTVVSTNSSPLAARVIGNVRRVLVSEGDAVRAGQLLVEIDSRDAVAQTARAQAGGREVEHAIAAAQANASLAASTLARYEALIQRKSVSAQEYDDVKARNAAAQAQLAQAMARRDDARAAGVQAGTFLDHSFVRSPIDGVVTRRFVDPGAQAAPGMPLVAVEDARSLRVEATVPEEFQLRPGDALTVDAAGTRIEGRVSHVQPNVEPSSRSSLVKIAVPASPALRSGAYVRVLLPAGERQALVIPQSALVRRGGLTSVYVVDTENIVRLRLVTVGQNGEVLAGLDAGERIVLEPSQVSDGAKLS